MRLNKGFELNGQIGFYSRLRDKAYGCLEYKKFYTIYHLKNIFGYVKRLKTYPLINFRVTSNCQILGCVLVLRNHTEQTSIKT